jgi:hypothetical protein
MNITRSITENLFTQCVNIIGNKDNQKKLQCRVMDPLIDYFKYKLKFFFIIIIVLLCCILLGNILMILYFINLKSIIQSLNTHAMSQLASSVPVMLSNN